MARRVVIGRRANGEVGIFVSRPGYDAWDCAESALLFSAQRRHFMMVQTGSVFINGAGIGSRVNFAYPPGQVPFVLCGHWNGKPTKAPVIAYVDINGFTAYPRPGVLGDYPAGGAWAPYYAFLKSQ